MKRHVPTMMLFCVQKEAAHSQYDETSKKQVGVEAGILRAEAAL